MAIEKSKLEELVTKENIKYNEPMSKHTSFKTGGNAEIYIIAKTEDEVKKVIKYSEDKDIPLHIMGNGTNFLVQDSGIRGIMLKIDIQTLYINESDQNEVIVTAGAGIKIMGLAQILKQKGLTGFEELSGIPGTIGGANRMNAGAHGKEIKDIIIETKCIDKNGKTIVFKNNEQNLVYRSSIFKNNKYIIIETKLKLSKGNTEDIEQKMIKYLKQRREKQPLEYPSAGSTFKRGNGFITSKLIDECGLKGYSIGGAQISEKHAGFIINKGDATSKDILDLIEYTKKKVYEKFEVIIEEEIEVI